MRWNSLFADLEAQASALATAERAGEVAELVRAETAGLTLTDRLRGADGPVEITGFGTVTRGVVRRLGSDWLLLEEESGAEIVIRLATVRTVSGLSRWSVPVVARDQPIDARLGLASVLRAVATDRAPVDVRLTDATTRHGTFDRVGSDFVDLALHAPEEARRATHVRAVVTVPFTAIAFVRRG